MRLDTAVPYTGSYNDVVDQGQREVNAGFEPKLKPLPVNVANYDVIAVGHADVVVHDGSRRQGIPAWTEFCRQDRWCRL